MGELRRAIAAIVLVLGLIGTVAPAAAATDPEPTEPPPTEVPGTEPAPSDPPATEVPDTEPDGSTVEPVDDDVDWDAYVVAAVLGFAFLVVVAAWIMVHRRDDDVGPRSEPPSSI